MSQAAITVERPSPAQPDPSSPRPKRLPPARAGALEALAEAVAQLHVTFSNHIAQQEGRCGFLAFMGAAAPRYITLLEHLRAEHQHLAAAIASLRMKVHRAGPAQWESLVAETDAIASAIADHESLEREILIDALEAP
jgi:hypothetical protein